MSNRQTSSRSFPTFKKINSKLAPILKASALPTLVATAVHRNGESIEYCYGQAIWGEEEPVTSKHIFRIASMTKLITSIAALQLVEKGVLKLDSDLSELMPKMTDIPILQEGELKRAQKPITLRHLLTHTSGFGYFFTDSALATFDRKGWEYEDLPRRFEVGTRFLYGTSTDWVGKLVEEISGQTLEEYFNINILEPLGMSRTFFNVPEHLKSEIVSFGSMGRDGKQPIKELPGRVPEKEVTNYNGGGGLFSSPEDYNNLLICMLKNGKYNGAQILSETSIEEMFKNQIGEISLDLNSQFFPNGTLSDASKFLPQSAKWSLAGMIDMEDRPSGIKKGTLAWSGIYNTYYFIDRKSGIAASIYTQYLPFNHPKTTTIFEAFSALLYESN